MKKTIAIDFDGVIHKYSKGWHDGTIYDEPMPGAFKALIELYLRGYQVAIYSTRDPKDIQKWLGKYWDEELGKNTEMIPITITKEKLPAIAYIDDRGIRFTNWKDILNYF